MCNMENLKQGNRINVRYKSLIQFAEVVFNNTAERTLTLKIVTGGCCGNIVYSNIAYNYDSFDLKC